MLKRVLETEVMDTREEAVGYDTMDHSEVNRVFVGDFLAAATEIGVDLDEQTVIDLGTGTAQIPIELCQRHSTVRVVAVDAALHMLAVAKQNITDAGLLDRITLESVDAKGLTHADGTFQAVMSNSIVHHIPEPIDVLQQMWRVTASGGLIFIRDLMRPKDDATVTHLVDTYAADATDHQRQMLDDSLRAALSLEEIRELVTEVGGIAETVVATSDRHWTWMAKK